jgi:hypothetical protein
MTWRNVVLNFLRNSLRHPLDLLRAELRTGALRGALTGRSRVPALSENRLRILYARRRA